MHGYGINVLQNLYQLRMVRDFMVSLIRTSLVNKGFNMNNIVYLRETAVEDMRDKNKKVTMQIF